MIILQIIGGLLFILVLFTLLASAIQEVIANYISLRGVMLMKTLQHLLDPNGEGGSDNLYRRLIRSATFKQICRPRSHSPYGRFLDWLEVRVRRIFGYGAIGNEVQGPPAFVSANSFSTMIQHLDWTPAGMEALPKGPIRDFVQSLMQSGEMAAHEKLQALHSWYDDVMNGATDWYRRQARFILIFIGFVLAAGFNLDLVKIGRTLSDNEVLRAQLYSDMERWMEERADTYFQEDGQLREGVLVQKNDRNIIVIDPTLRQDAQSFTLRQIVGQKVMVNHWTGWFSVLASWLMTAVLISFGAPFWFDLLRKLVRISKPV